MIALHQSLGGGGGFPADAPLYGRSLLQLRGNYMSSSWGLSFAGAAYEMYRLKAHRSITTWTTAVRCNSGNFTQVWLLIIITGGWRVRAQKFATLWPFDNGKKLLTQNLPPNSVDWKASRILLEWVAKFELKNSSGYKSVLELPCQLFASRKNATRKCFEAIKSLSEPLEGTHTFRSSCAPELIKFRWLPLQLADYRDDLCSFYNPFPNQFN